MWVASYLLRFSGLRTDDGVATLVALAMSSVPISPEVWDQVQASIHRFIFTPEDFRELIQRQLLAVFKHSPKLVEGFADLRDSGVEEMIQSYVFEILGMPKQYEFKISATADPGWLSPF